jgi:uncharacterized membrane protein YgcG
MKGTEPREPAAWLATIARNECWSRISARMREPLAMEQLDTVATTNDPLSEAIRRADLAALWRAIETLPRQQRDALLLREFGGLSYGELSAALAVSGAAVESLLFRARQRLRGQLRTVYASVSGASWIDALVRLVAGGGAPVAAKVAALGVGAAVVGGTAVVVPNVLDNHHPHSTKPTPAAVVHRKEPLPPPLLVERVVSTPTRSPAHAHVTPAPIARVSSEHDTEQGTHGASQHEEGSEQTSVHIQRAETSNENAGGGSGDQGDRSGSGGHGDGQKGGGGDGSGSSGEGSDGGSSPAIPQLPALPPLPPPPSGDDGGN